MELRLRPVWIEIPVRDIERALKFYGTLFGVEGHISDDGVRRTVTLMYDEESKVGISINQTANFEPGDKGVFIYLDAGDDLDRCLPLVEPAGGKILAQKTSMGQAGCYATIQDTEGNTLALYSYATS